MIWQEVRELFPDQFVLVSSQGISCTILQIKIL